MIVDRMVYVGGVCGGRRTQDKTSTLRRIQEYTKITKLEKLENMRYRTRGIEPGV